MKHPFLVIMVALLCIPASVHAQGAPSAMTRSETIPFLAVQLHDRVDVHNGPGANYTMVGWLPAGSILKVIGCSVECTWLQIASAGWITTDQVTPAIAYTQVDGVMVVRAPVMASTAAQLPTATPPMVVTAAPTNLPILTSMPSDTPTSVPTAEVDEVAFIGEAQRILGNYSTALQQFSTLAINAGNDPALMLSETWTLDMGVAVASIRALNNEIRTLNAPSAFAAAWGEMRVAADKYDQAMDTFVSGVDNMDVNQINQATQLMREGQAAVERAATLLPSGTAISTPAPTEIPMAEATATLVPTPTTTPPTSAPQEGQAPNCDPSYPDFCLQPGLPDLDCGDEPIRNYARFRVLPPDPHDLDREHDGIGCENN